MSNRHQNSSLTTLDYSKKYLCMVTDLTGFKAASDGIYRKNIVIFIFKLLSHMSY